MSEQVQLDSFSTLLRRYRLDAGLTQEALAERAGLSVRGIQDLERGVTRPLKDTRQRLLAAFDLPPTARGAFEAAAMVRRMPPATSANDAASALSSGHTSSLPPRLTSLIGRDEDLARLGVLLRRRDVRLVTLIGPGGIGKTSLALQAARQVGTYFEAGAQFVDLASLGDPMLLASAIAKVAGVDLASERPIADSLIDHLRDKQLLLMLDSFEHVLGGAPFVAELLRECLGLTILVTSRAALHMRGEQQIEVLPLPTPPPRDAAHALIPNDQDHARSLYPAVALFLDRARAVKPEFALTAENAAAVGAICARLDGLPLAIELAASRILLLSPAALLARLDRRLQVLIGGALDLPARQRTLRHALAWSYDLLPLREQELFASLAIFAGGWTLAAAESIHAGASYPRDEIFDGLVALVDSSLIRADHSATVSDEPRFGMLETIAEYARERLDARPDINRLAILHALYYLALAEEAAPDLRGPKQPAALARLDAELENLRAALPWARAHLVEKGVQDGRPACTGQELGLRMAVALHDFWRMRGQTREGLGWLRAFLPAAGTPGPAVEAGLLSHALSRAAELAVALEDPATARALIDAALAAVRDSDELPDLARALLANGALACRQEAYAAAHAIAEAALVHARALDDPWLIAHALTLLGRIARLREDYDGAAALYERALAVCRKAGDHWEAARVLHELGQVAQDQGDLGQAARVYGESLVLGRQLGDRQGIAATLLHLGYLARVRGDLQGALAVYRESMALLGKLEDREGVAQCLEGLAYVVSAQGRAAQGARLLGGAATLRASRTPAPDGGSKTSWMAGPLARISLGAPWAAGAALSLDQAIRGALELAEPA